MEKYFKPLNEITDRICNKYKDQKVLEIGPGDLPLPIATHFIDCTSTFENTTIIDITNTEFPFKDKEFDFIYCRHVLEDIHNIEFVLNEIERVAKAGYIECPSVYAEMQRAIEFDNNFFRGYVHHLYIVWVELNTLYFLPKYPLVEYLRIPDKFLELHNKFYWNTYYLWENSINFNILKHGINFNVKTNYIEFIERSLKNSKYSINKFKELLCNL